MPIANVQRLSSLVGQPCSTNNIGDEREEKSFALTVAPVLKWVGGKRQLLPLINERLPSTIDAYTESFFGGGALDFHLQPNVMVMNDCNEELINFYSVVKTDLAALLEDVKRHKNTKAYYYKLRALDRGPDYWDASNTIQRASRLLYLNKTCYNGLYRVNRAGEFNAPYGHYASPTIADEKRLTQLSAYLNEARVFMHSVDFEKLETFLPNTFFEGNAFFFLDPPYLPMTDTASFTGYTSQGFNFLEQVRLKNFCDRLTEKNIKFLQCNSAHPDFISLYKAYTVEFVDAKRNINCKADKRGPINEVFIRNYTCEGELS